MTKAPLVSSPCILTVSSGGGHSETMQPIEKIGDYEH